MRRVLQWVGRVLVTTGALLVLFVVYQLWGTGLVQAADQRELKGEFRDVLSTAEVASADPARLPTTPQAVEPPPLGEALGILSIPAIGIEQALVEGAGTDDLDKGPGHYPHSPLPGHAGNVAVAGHRTTYGAPFNRIDELKPGDEIVVETVEGTFTYEVTGQKIVAPDDVSVIDHTDDNRITLTTCNPKYSAKERLVVVGALAGKPLDAPPGAASPVPDGLADEEVRSSPAASQGGSESGLAAVRGGTVLWALGLLAIGALWWTAFRRRTRWTTWVAGALPFLAVLFFFFGEVERLLPANY